MLPLPIYLGSPPRMETYHPFGTETLVTTTLKDVAQRAGVSIKTVSNVVHGYPHVTEEMRERVRAALEELKYQPNLPARYLRKGRVGVLALAIPHLSNPYFADIGHAVIAAAAQSYTVLIDCTGGERANELLVLDGLRPHLIDGAILIAHALEPKDLQAREVKVPLVLVGSHLLDVAFPYDRIIDDNVAAGRWVNGPSHSCLDALLERAPGHPNGLRCPSA